jgi:hypothetical protein
MTETGLLLPKAKISANRVNPQRLVIYSKPKAGKTTFLAGLDNNLIIDLESGSDYVNALKLKVNTLDELKQVGEQIKKSNYPYKFISIDTVTILEDLIKPLAVKLYVQTPMGKNFNGDDVTKLANGAGYMYMRDAFFQVLDYIDTLAPHIILAGHIKDKQVDDKGELVMAANIDLTGKIKSLVCSQADAIGYLFRKNNQTFLSFKSNDEVTCGARPAHLKNQEILVAEEIDGVYKTYWDKIYK